MIKKSFIGLLSLTLPVISIASPYSSWDNEREYRHNGITVYKAEVNNLPYDRLVKEAYYGKSQEDINLQMIVGKTMETGELEVPINLDESIRWYNKAALNGDIHGAFKMYENTRNANDSEREMGLEWLEFASNQGHVDAIYEMGMLKFEGFNMGDEELNDVLQYFTRADRLGHPMAKYKIESINEEVKERENKEKIDEFLHPFKFEE